jgi:hypothetical protein
VHTPAHLLLLLLLLLQIPVPSNWECYGHGTPIYTNCEWLVWLLGGGGM